MLAKQKHLPAKDVELAVKHLLEDHERRVHRTGTHRNSWIRQFLLSNYRPPRMGRNPKTGEAVALAGKYVPHFKPGKDLRERVNANRLATEIKSLTRGRAVDRDGSSEPFAAVE